jgi:hypothetical protein
LIKPVKTQSNFTLPIKESRQQKDRFRKNYNGLSARVSKISMQIGNNLSTAEWKDIYKKLVRWELNLEKSKDSGMDGILKMQKEEANQQFSRFYVSEYMDWLNNSADDIPVMSHTLVKKNALTTLKRPKTCFLVYHR